ncbi:MAG TPA: metalloregulator ArsR/SmtB family transcription factor [Acetobacteraceae bacterium]|jgi:DNA-binding transcriptional ArsR family regulator|nr:metalloregulator ArsR/SmtB family transcription factor [Acetobacteraceae bacterium]
MVKYKETDLSRTFSALMDPTRRAILARLAREPGLSVSELARPFPLKLPAVMKHLDVLSDAGLVSRSKTGRTVSVTLTPRPMQEAMAWLKRYERFWSESLDRLAAYVEEEAQEWPKNRA